ncbi:MAG: hypothetical protein ACRD1R_04415 [Acidobacteriota bacterium]
MACAGNVPTLETLAAIQILRERAVHVKQLLRDKLWWELRW